MKSSKRDDHGKGEMTSLDTSFEFVDFDTSGSSYAPQLKLGNDNTTTFSEKLRTHLVASIAINEYFEDIVENNGENYKRADGSSFYFVVKSYFSDIDGIVIDEINEVLDGVVYGILNTTKKKCFFDQLPTLAEPQRHFTRSSLDASIAAIFGEKTSIGQVCSYAQGLKDGNVTTVSGFCCLDAPYEADYWGELVRNILFKLKSTK